jgi:type IV fimbrial biogenesis protein FimT
MNASRGYTLIELMIAVAIAAVLGAVALPAFSGALEASRSSSVETSLLASLTRSIHRAAITGTRSVLCPSLDGAQCSDGPDWSGGWIAFLDRNGDRERGLDETLLLSEPALPGKVRLRTSVGRTRIVFQGNGGNAGSNVTFTLCDGRGPARARTLVLNNVGRLRHGTPSAESAAAACATR